MSVFSEDGVSRRTMLRGAGAATALALTGGRARAQSNAALKIGAVASLTGPASAFSKDWADGFRIYVKDWNRRGGHGGRDVELEILDDETNAISAVNAFRRLAGDPKVNVVWIALASQTALGIKAVSSEFKVPVLSGGGVDELGKPAAPYFFKIAPGGSDYIKAVVDFVKRSGHQRLASINANDALGQSDARNIRAFAKAAGVEVVAQESYALTDTNFNVQLIKLRNAKPDFLYNGATGNPAILVFNQLRQLRIDVPMALSQAAISGAFFKGIGGRDKIEGLYSVISVGALPAEVGGETARHVAELGNALGKPALLFHTFGWDTGIATEWAVKHSDGSRQGMRDALEKIKELSAINGPLTFTAENHIGQDTRGLTVAQFRGGKWMKVA